MPKWAGYDDVGCLSMRPESRDERSPGHPPGASFCSWVVLPLGGATFEIVFERHNGTTRLGLAAAVVASIAAAVLSTTASASITVTIAITVPVATSLVPIGATLVTLRR